MPPAAPCKAAQPDLSRFRCRRCGACCRLPGGLVRLREGESAALAAARPAQCREFPFSWRNPDSSRTCPGLRACL